MFVSVRQNNKCLVIDLSTYNCLYASSTNIQLLDNFKQFTTPEFTFTCINPQFTHIDKLSSRLLSSFDSPTNTGSFLTEIAGFFTHQ